MVAQARGVATDRCQSEQEGMLLSTARFSQFLLAIAACSVLSMIYAIATELPARASPSVDAAVALSDGHLRHIATATATGEVAVAAAAPIEPPPAAEGHPASD